MARHTVRSFLRHFLAAPVLMSVIMVPARAEPTAVHGPNLPAAMAKAPATPAECAQAYHTRLGQIRTGEFETLKAIRIGAAAAMAGDPSLPGAPVFTTRQRNLTPEAQKAQRLAARLASQRGSLAMPLNANTRWVAERVRTELSDYLAQGPSPYLCSGVDEYLSTLRGYAGQVSLTPQNLDQAIAAQQSTARASIDAAFATMRPVAAPHFAPDDRPDPLMAGEAQHKPGEIDTELHTGAIIRVAQRQPANPVASDESISGDLAPQEPAVPVSLENAEDIRRQIDRLASAAAEGGFLALPVPAEPDAARRNIARLAAIRPAVTGMTDPLVSPAISAALADLEALDYLVAARHGGTDPLGAALGGTMDAIGRAHTDACRCRG